MGSLAGSVTEDGHQRCSLYFPLPWCSWWQATVSANSLMFLLVVAAMVVPVILDLTVDYRRNKLVKLCMLIVNLIFFFIIRLKFSARKTKLLTHRAKITLMWCLVWFFFIAFLQWSNIIWKSAFLAFSTLS